MMRATREIAALRRSLVVVGLTAVCAASVRAQQTTDTANKKPATKNIAPPATKTVAPPATKSALPPDTKTIVPAPTVAKPPTTKTVTPPVTKPIPQPTTTKTVTPPVTKSVTQQAPASKTTAPATKSPVAGPQSKTTTAATKSATPPNNKPVTAPAVQGPVAGSSPLKLPPKPADEGIIARLMRMVGLGPKPASAPQPKKVTAPVPQTKSVSTPPTKTLTPPAQQTKTAAKSGPVAGAKTAAAIPQPPAQTKAGAPPKSVTPAGSVTTPGAPVTTPAPTQRRLDIAISDTAIAKPLVIMREVFSYDVAGRRDPFVSLLTTNDLRPTLSDLKLLGTVVDEPGRSVALLMDNSQSRADRKQVSVRVGSRLGRMRVSNIRANVVVFTITEFGMNRIDSLLLRDSTKARGR
jgi:hypothetical protein